MHAYLRNYVQQLRDEAEESARQHQERLDKEKSQQKPNTLRLVKPLDVQITELMASLPPAQLERKWAMADLVARLEGRYRDRPHPQMIGAALRKLGWSTLRDWTIAGGGRRYWTSNDQRTLNP